MTQATQSDVRELLSGIPFFRRLSFEALELIAPLVRLSKFRKGEMIFSEGSDSTHFYWVTVGRVKVFKSTPGGKETILEIFNPGDPFGAVAVFEGAPYPASAVATEETTCIIMARGAFLAALEKNPVLVRGLLSSITHRMIQLTNRLATLSGGRIESRLARLFLGLAESCGRPRGDATFVPLRFARQELADMVGTSLETCIRIMSRWEKEHVIHSDPHGFLILRRDDLEDFTT